VPSVDEALKEVLLQPVHGPFRELVNAETFRQLMEARRWGAVETEERDALADEVEERMLRVVQKIQSFADGGGEAEAIARGVRRELDAAWSLPAAESRLPVSESAAQYLREGPAGTPNVGFDDGTESWSTLLGWLFTHSLGRAADGDAFAQISRSWLDEWLLGKITAAALQELGLDEGTAWWRVSTIKVLTAHQRWFEIEAADEGRAYQVLHAWLEDEEVQRFLRVNRYQDVLWFNAEAFQELLWWMFVTAATAISANHDGTAEEAAEAIAGCYRLVETLQQAEAASDYRVERLLEAARG
jgi:hypothetical protein